MEEERFEVNDGHYLEVMDRLAIFTHMIDSFVGEHPLINHLDNPKLEKHLQTAITNLWDAYQLVGKLEDNGNTN